MFPFALCLCLVGADLDYATAYEQATKERRPLVVLATATWCQPCQRIKADPVLFPRLRREAIFAVIDVDQEPELAAELGVTVVPTVVRFRPSGLLNWKKLTVVGETAIRDHVQKESDACTSSKKATP